MKKCPKCRVQHFDGVTQCECGYDFVTGKKSATATNSAEQSGSIGKRLIAGAAGAVALALAMSFGKMVGGEAASVVQPTATDTAPPVAAPNPVETVVVRQAAGDMADRLLDTATVRELEQTMAKEMLEKARAAVAQKGFGNDAISNDMVKSSSYVAELGGHRYGIVRIDTPRIKMKSVVAVSGHEFVRLTCFRRHGGDIPLGSGPCADAMESTFGVRMR